MMRRGLQREFTPAALFTGQGVHIGLEGYYANNQSVDAAVERFGRWIASRTRRIEEFGGPMWDQEREMVDETLHLGHGMLRHYALWAPSVDQHLAVVATEQMFRVPLYYESKHVKSPLYLAGRMDGIARDVRTGDLYILEFKTTRSLKDTSWVFNTLQGAAYVWAARQMYGPSVKGVLYRMLRKRIPDEIQPLVRTPGAFSRAKNQQTSFEYFKYALAQWAHAAGVSPLSVYKLNEEMLRYLHSTENLFFQERLVVKNDASLDNVLQAIRTTGMQMADPDVVIFKSPPLFYCNICPFRDPCTLKEAGGDWQGVLEAEYAPRDYWESEFDDEESGNGN